MLEPCLAVTERLLEGAHHVGMVDGRGGGDRRPSEVKQRVARLTRRLTAVQHEQVTFGVWNWWVERRLAALARQHEGRGRGDIAISLLSRGGRCGQR